MRSGSESVLQFVDFASQFRKLGSGQSQSLLMLLHLASERPDFVCSFLSQSVQPFALLSEDRDFVLSLGPHSFSRVLGFNDAALQFFVFATDEFELVLEFSHLSSGETQVLLRGPYFLAKTAVL